MKISYLRSGRLAGVCALLSALAVGSDLAGQTSIWPASAVPTLIDGGTDAPVELGVKFRSDVAGTISGIRFYKALANTGTHVGKLWSSTGTLLASTTFTNETASGWQQMNFPSPVAISAGTVYIASYRCANGHYSADVNYFSTSGVDNPPLHALATGVAGGNGVFTYGSGNTFPNQTWFAANYWVDVVFSATNSPTLTSIAVTPANATIAIDATRQFTATGTYSNGGTQNLTTQVTWASSSTGLATISSGGLATGVGAGTTTISASLSGVSGSATLVVQPASLSITTQLLAAATLNTSYSTTLASSGGTPPLTWSIASGSLPVGLMLNAGSGAITGIPTATGTFAFTVRVADSGNPQQAVTKAFNLTVSTAPTTRSIWPATTVPSLIDSGADNPVELGVKFRSDQAGTISGVRFYKAGANTGTHVGKLWSATGTLLASATFTGETASGWQQVNFSAPVSIAANTTYVASYHCASGHYSADANYFTSSFDSPPLHAPSSATTGGNGVYAYGSGSFPNSTWNAANYWVDVVFSSSTQTDTTRPTINTVSPGDGATNVSLGSSISTIFSEPMDPATITGSTITLRNSLNTSVPATVSYSAANRTATLTPTNTLTASTAYTATVLGGQSGVADLAGNRLLASQSWTFTTAASNPWGDGPGGPILVVTSTGNPFTEYYAEILLAEGLNAFTLQNISSVTSDTLAGYDLVILGEQTLTDAQVTMFTTWVNAGGNLIALRPDKKLAVLLGLTDAGSTLMEGYLLVNTASAPGAGIVGETIQFHGGADRYVLSGATTVATLYSSPAA
ncbi:MAG TPA: DUF4082 domain-containing protein, partial [Opitutus sp.]|nr:DUF4082 domain-containing protein [Opitutus sp.]